MSHILRIGCIAVALMTGAIARAEEPKSSVGAHMNGSTDTKGNSTIGGGIMGSTQVGPGTLQGQVGVQHNMPNNAPSNTNVGGSATYTIPLGGGPRK